MLRILTLLTNAIDSFTELLGRSIAYLSILMVLVTCYIVIARYVFNTGSIATQEVVTYLNAALFTLAAGYTLKHNGHVRVDVFYGKASIRYKAWADLLGTLFLLMPVTVFILVMCQEYVSAAWSIREQSGEAGGLPYVYLLKSLMPGLCYVILLQGMAEIMRNICVLFYPDSPLARTHTEEAAGTV